MDYERLKERVIEFLKAVSRLEDALNQSNNEFIRDSVIQRFEFTYELAWKMLKLKLESEGIFSTTPKQTFQEALQAGFIENGNHWTDIQKNRNLTTHTYDELLAEKVYEFVRDDALPQFKILAGKAKTW